jgi:hypothetical protein
MTALLLALVAAVDVAAEHGDPESGLVLSTQVASSGGVRSVAASATAGGLSRGQAIRLRLMAGKKILCESVSGPDPSGRASATCPQAPRASRVAAVATTESNGRVLRREQRSLDP